jgi:hypothetical protein
MVNATLRVFAAASYFILVGILASTFSVRAFGAGVEAAPSMWLTDQDRTQSVSN